MGILNPEPGPAAGNDASINGAVKEQVFFDKSRLRICAAIQRGANADTPKRILICNEARAR